MELAEIVKWLAYLATGIGGWFLKMLWDAQKELREDMKRIELNLSENYTKRNDFKEAILELKEEFKEMSQPIFRKLDKIEEFLLHSKEK